MSEDALVGFSGFVGGSLLRQTRFGAQYRSTNIREIRGREFRTLVCAGAPAQKWLANSRPEDDAKSIDELVAHISAARASRVILISTVDVFKTPVDVDESTAIETEGLHPYGLNRYRLEQAIAGTFPEHLIVRLPGLVGPGLKKNVVYDIKNDNNVAEIDPSGSFQFYPMVNLWYDIQIALVEGLRLIHLTAEPVTVDDVISLGFGKDLDLKAGSEPVRYDVKTLHSHLWQSALPYQYGARASLQAIRSYAQFDTKAT